MQLVTNVILAAFVAGCVSAQEVNPEYVKAEKRASRKCEGCDPVQVIALREHINKQRARGLELPALLRDARSWCEEQGLIDPSYQHCLAALGKLACVERYLPAGPPVYTDQEIAEQLAALPAVIQQVIQASERERSLAIVRNKRDLNRLQNELNAAKKKPLSLTFSGTTVKVSKDERRRREKRRTANFKRLREGIVFLHDRLHELSERPTFNTPSMSGDSLTVGAVGDIYFYNRAQGASSTTVGVQQILDERNMLVRHGDTLLWLRGFSTTDLVTDSTISLNRLLHVSGTKNL